jgi:AraC-like DNA-binding protein
MMSVISIVNIFFASHCFLISFLLFLSRNNRAANFVMALLQMFTGFFFLLSFLSGIEFMKHSSIPVIISISLVYFMAPLIYLYTIRLSETKTSRDFLHFIPPFITMIYSFVRLVTISNWDLQIDTLPLDLFIIFQSSMIAYNCYIFFMHSLIKSYQNNLEERFSTMRHIRLKWLRIILSISSIAIVLFFISNIADYFFPVLYPALFLVIDVLSYILIMLFLLSIAYFSFLQPEINIESKSSRKGPSYEKQRLGGSLEMTYLNKLLTYMEEEKPYLFPDLSIGQLAEQVSIPAAQLTMILNTRAKQNFYHFINSYRIKAACHMLEQDEQKNILTIAMDVGFNSKTTFNTFFKKNMKMTPREYRKKIV